MNKDNWTDEWEDTAYYDNDGNDFYYKWVDLYDLDLVDLFEKYLDVKCGRKARVKVKVMDGAIFIERIKNIEWGDEGY